MQTKQSLAIPSIPNCLIPLGKGRFAIVDPEDYLALNQFTWRARKSHSTLYAVRRTTHYGRRKLIFMHRQILSAPDDMQVHHLNHNPLDNRRCNLMLLTPKEHKAVHHLYQLEKRRPSFPDDQIHAHR